jgi:hypothetical protein
MYYYTKNIGSLFNIFLNEKLQKEQFLYKNAINKREVIEQNINKLLENDSSLLAKYVGNMIGGNFFENDVTPQINTLRTLFDDYNKLINVENEQLKENTEEIKKKTESILESLKKVNTEMQKKIDDKKIEIEKVVGPQSIIQDINYLLLDLQKDGTTEGVYKRLTELRSQKIPFDEKKAEYIKFKTYLETLKEYNSQLKKDIKNMNVENEQEISEIEKKYNNISTEIRSYINELDELIITYDVKNKEYIESMKTNQANIDKVITFDPTIKQEREENGYNEDLTNIENSLFKNKDMAEKINIQIKEFFNPDGYTLHRNPQLGVNSMKIQLKNPQNILHLQSGGILQNLEQINYQFISLVNEYKKKFTEYKRIFDEYNFLTLSIIQHLVYVLSVISTQIFETSNFSIFNFIGKGSINYYLRIIKKIINDFQDPNTSKQPHVVEMRKMHYATIMILDDFLTKLIKKVDAKKKINLFKSGEEIQRNITLLNHFRIILDEFNAKNLGKVSIFSRINNLKFKDPEDTKALRMFMSDYEIKQLKNLVDPKIKLLLKYLDYIQKLPLENQSHAIIKMIGKKSDFIQKIQLDQKYLGDTEPLDDLMWVVKEPCNTYNNEDYEYINPLSSMKFTEVFDSTQFPGNDDISKYMQIASRLKDGFGVCLITYGYSGTGKTFTLFGDKGSATKPPVNGLLQATLGELNGLDEISFRVYELYGYGVPYTQYWIDKQNKNATRVNNIDSILIKYKLNLGSGNVLDASQDDYIDSYNGIINYIQETKKQPESTAGYIKINSIIKIKDAFANFKLLTDKIDDIRKEEIKDEIKNKKFPPRIRDTPNNKESSRSIIVYEFKLTIKENGIPKTSTFLIVDLPGREDIAKTFVDPYQKPTIQNAIKEGFNLLKPKSIVEADILKNDNILNHYQSSSESDKYLSYCKLLILSMTLNPMVVPVLAPQQFINYIENKKNNKIITEIIGEKLLTERYGADAATPEYSELPMVEEYINRFNNKLDKVVKYVDDKIELTLGSTGKPLTLIGYDDKFANLQHKIVFCIHFMNRLLLLKKFDIIKDLYQKIIDDKINSYIKEYIQKLDLVGLRKLIVDAINENFKGEYLKEKLQTEDGLKKTFASFSDKTKLDKIINFFINNNVDQTNLSSDDELKQIRDKIFNEIKFNYIVNGFEGIYINENIMGIVKYLKGLSLDKGEVSNEEKLRLEMEQNTSLGFAFQQKIARMLLASNMIYTVKPDEDVKTKKPIDYNQLSVDYNNIKVDITKLNNLIDLESLYKQQLKIDKKIKNIQEEESTKQIKIIELYKFNKILEEIDDKNMYDKIKETKLNETKLKALLTQLNLVMEPNLTVKIIKEKINEIFNLDFNKDKLDLIKKLYKQKEDFDRKISEIKRVSKISDNLYEAITEYPKRVYDILFEKPDNPDYNKLYERLFNPGFIFRDKKIFDENFSRLNSGYQPDKIFTFSDPIIKNILSPYVDEVDGKAIVSDYKVFYLFANYGKEIEQVGQLKCANQNELLMTTRNFIESVTK